LFATLTIDASLRIGSMLTTTISPDAELRSLEPWQADEFARHMGRALEHIRPWVGSSFVSDDVDGARATLIRYAESAMNDGGRIFGIWSRGQLVGGVMFVEFNAAAGTCGIGCWLEPGAEGHGYATTACRELLRWAFEVRGLHRVEWQCRADNTRSSAVAARLGMTLEGLLREAWLNSGVFHDMQVWSLLSQEWRAARGSADDERLRASADRTPTH
jgi:RimJ/RimL family protein N-acetyltransferase